MKALAIAVALVALSSPAFAGAPQVPVSLNLHLAINAAGAPRAYDLVVGADHQCALANQRSRDVEDHITVCASGEGRLDIEWFTRGAGSEYHTRGSVVLGQRGSAELGVQNGPRLTVTVQ